MLKNRPVSCLSPVKQLGVLILSGLFFLSIFVSLAHAHATVLWCYVENNQVYVEAFFMGGNKVQNGKIVVVDNNGKKILEGTTNKQGLFDFVPPNQDDMTIVLQIDTGHGADFKLTRQDFLDAAQETAESHDLSQ
jgi:nickel transport protein